MQGAPHPETQIVAQPAVKETVSPEELVDHEPGNGSRVMRGVTKFRNRLIASWTIALGALALVPGDAKAMDEGTKNLASGLAAAFLVKSTGVVVRPDFKGNPTLDVGATMHNRQIMEQQQQQRAFLETGQRKLRQIIEIFNKPTNFDIEPALEELRRMGITVVKTDNSLFLYDQNMVGKPGFLNSQFKITSTNTTKITNLKLTPIPGGFIMQSHYVSVNTSVPNLVNLLNTQNPQDVQNVKAFSATEERVLAVTVNSEGNKKVAVQ